MRSPRQFKRVQCLFLGHDDVEVTLTLGKLVPEKVEVMKCRRCNRILVPIRSLDIDHERPESKAN